MTGTISSGSPFPDNIDTFPAGPELDALLAERVLGAKVGRYVEQWSGYRNWIATTPDGAELYIMLSPHSPYGGAPLWNPSTNLADARMLVQHLQMHSDYQTLTEEALGENGYSATLSAELPTDNEVTGARPGDGPQHMEIDSTTGTGPTEALALCRAAFKAASGISRRQSSL